MSRFRSCYPNDELARFDRLYELLEEWKSFLFSGKQIAEQITPDAFLHDGFFPYFTRQKRKVLFIGREAHSLWGLHSYLEFLAQAYKANTLGDRKLDQYQFHNMMFYIAYGLNNQDINGAFPVWQDIPYASELTETFMSEEGLSFAVMNLSKISNESGNWDAAWESLIWPFVEASAGNGRNFFNEQIGIINPDLIIGMNLGAGYPYLGNIRQVGTYGNQGQVDVYELDVAGKSIPLLDTFHFAAPSKSPEKDYYLPIVRAVQDMVVWTT